MSLAALVMYADVESADGEVHRCNIRRTIRLLVTGDRVVWRPQQPQRRQRASLEAVHERTGIDAPGLLRRA